MLGGIWNAEAVPAGYGGAVSACWLAVVLLAGAGYLVAARSRRISPGAGVAAVAGILRRRGRADRADADGVARRHRVLARIRAAP